MIDSILKEIELRKDYLDDTINTIYFGGGTPSILTKEEISIILAKINGIYPVSENVELTLEANPDDITLDQLSFWKETGINRLSIGLQSFKESDLKWMNRAHTVEEANQCVSLAQDAGFNNLTVDLIYGLPDLSLAEWKDHVQRLIDLNVPHISAYCLTVEKNTVLSNWVAKGKIAPPSEDVQSEQFLALLEILEANDYEQYEISNFCKKGFESKHNSNYWKGEKYIGIGPSAHSFNGTTRSWNVANNSKYIKAISANTSYYEVEELSKENQFNELIMTGLRTKYGVDLERLNAIITTPKQFIENLALFKKNGWVLQEQSTISLSKEGKLMADYIASELFVI